MRIVVLAYAIVNPRGSHPVRGGAEKRTDGVSRWRGGDRDRAKSAIGRALAKVLASGEAYVAATDLTAKTAGSLGGTFGAVGAAFRRARGAAEEGASAIPVRRLSTGAGASISYEPAQLLFAPKPACAAYALCLVVRPTSLRFIGELRRRVMMSSLASADRRPCSTGAGTIPKRNPS